MHTVPNNFWQWYTSLSEDSQALIPVFGAMFVCVMLAILATTIYKMHKNRLDDELKRDLLDRGMSADEIVEVINAKSNNGETGRVRQSPGEASR